MTIIVTDCVPETHGMNGTLKRTAKKVLPYPVIKTTNNILSVPNHQQQLLPATNTATPPSYSTQCFQPTSSFHISALPSHTTHSSLSLHNHHSHNCHQTIGSPNKHCSSHATVPPSCQTRSSQSISSSRPSLTGTPGLLSLRPPRSPYTESAFPSHSRLTKEELNEKIFSESMRQSGEISESKHTS